MKRPQIRNVKVHAVKREPSYAVGRNENWCLGMATVETSMEAPQIVKNAITV